MEDLIGDLTAVPQPIEVKLFSDDPEAARRRRARKVADAIGKVQGVVEVVNGLRVAGDAIVIHVDRAPRQSRGSIPRRSPSSSAAGRRRRRDAGSGWASSDRRARPRTRRPARARRRTRATCSCGNRRPAVALRRSRRSRSPPGQRQITREDLAPFVAVTARLEGRDLGSAMAGCKPAVAGAPSARRSVRVEYGGLYAAAEVEFGDLARVFVAALLLAALLLTFLFERWAYTLAVSPPCCCRACAVLARAVGHRHRTRYLRADGLTMVVGMITELAIF